MDILFDVTDRRYFKKEVALQHGFRGGRPGFNTPVRLNQHATRKLALPELEDDVAPLPDASPAAGEAAQSTGKRQRALDKAEEELGEAIKRVRTALAPDLAASVLMQAAMSLDKRILRFTGKAGAVMRRGWRPKKLAAPPGAVAMDTRRRVKAHGDKRSGVYGGAALAKVPEVQRAGGIAPRVPVKKPREKVEGTAAQRAARAVADELLGQQRGLAAQQRRIMDDFERAGGAAGAAGEV